MKLNEKGLINRKLWEEKGYSLPKFDRVKVREKTKENPQWIHFGAGNIFRAFQANLVQKLLNQGIAEKGLIVTEGYDYEIIEKINRPFDDYTILATLKVDGHIEKTVIGSIVESLTLDRENQKEFSRLKEIFKNPSLQLASFTITEKGYQITDSNGGKLEYLEDDIRRGPDQSNSYLGKVAALLYERFLAEAPPIAMVSMDNCSHNGEKLCEAIYLFAKGWYDEGLVSVGFCNYIETKVSFPWTMIDKITPRPDELVKSILTKDGVQHMEAVITSKHTYVAPFVNAEECEYLVIEDHFPNGRPMLEACGVIFTKRETVEEVEKMKVCTCLNPLHTTLAIFGCILGYQLISEEMKSPILKKLVEKVGYEEGLKVVVDPKIMDPKTFIDDVVKVRMPNPFMPDTPQRIATDTSQKLAIRFGETIKAYKESKHLDILDLHGIPLVFAGWLRYLMGITDKGEEFTLSPDPMLEELRVAIAGIELGYLGDLHEQVKPLLENEKIFGVNLYEVGLGKQVEAYFKRMIKGIGAVEEVLKEELK